jgi:hypothetical protein
MFIMLSYFVVINKIFTSKSYILYLYTEIVDGFSGNLWITSESWGSGRDQTQIQIR